MTSRRGARTVTARPVLGIYSRQACAPNPYTGRAAINEPAIAVWETGNELVTAFTFVFGGC